MLIEVGFKIGKRALYSDVEYKGEKIFADVKPSRHFYNGIPAAYVVYMDFEEEAI
jgi:hypothetical protein